LGRVNIDGGGVQKRDLIQKNDDGSGLKCFAVDLLREIESEGVVDEEGFETGDENHHINPFVESP
jgi:hypothetical protein